MKLPQVNNDLYRTMGHSWWDDNVGQFSAIRFFVNPARFSFFLRVLERERISGHATRTVLDVGCGGGILAEEFARAGFHVTGVDPAPESIKTAREHAAASGLDIAYETGSGERLPFAEASFDHVACCDVLEHVDDVAGVIGEIARVLKPGGLFLYDTINRTFLSKLVVIKVMQEWPSTSFVEPNLHIWERFITPPELCRLIEHHGLDQRELRGSRPGAIPSPTCWTCGGGRRARYPSRSWGEGSHCMKAATSAFPTWGTRRRRERSWADAMHTRRQTGRRCPASA
ncbi:MAG: bifunctional 2-polyprenyl-6-hydroxyphenol methylase/3-demethylubiquinol 3-O-methyltransferase UbiG [Candidatus Solibacter sp.]|nr:bifunctional 2-polyprenyl-6-hydroxyphenol methylase/3-demethylubiquinol 3-O-methyltransferase UbiG [Candidatus Solibacter sp.]